MISGNGWAPANQKSLMLHKKLVLACLTIMLSLTSCSVLGQGHPGASSTGCPDLVQIVNTFYTANDAGQSSTALSYLSEDVIMVFWAEGINGHHMGLNTIIGKDLLRTNLDQPGLHLKSRGENLPNFSQDHIRRAGNQLIFNLTPDRTHADGRPYDPYVVEMVFNNCRIEIIKIVERITWV
jgi:hypothetical protein